MKRTRQKYEKMAMIAMVPAPMNPQEIERRLLAHDLSSIFLLS